MSYQTILFDLDGTLTDPAEGITNSIVHSLTYYGIDVADKRDLYDFIGPPLHESYMRRFGMDEATSLEAVEHYREYFSVKGLFENEVYDGIEDLLRELRANGKQLLVATSKPEVYAVPILEHFGLAKYFHHICGALLHPPRGYGKADVIREALACSGVTDLGTAIMVGDRMHDIIGAHKEGISAIGVLYGYGDRAEHEACGADYIVSTVSDLKKLLLEG
jgi:phosphoglycolate phosphatase